MTKIVGTKVGSVGCATCHDLGGGIEAPCPECFGSKLQAGIAEGRLSNNMMLELLAQNGNEIASSPKKLTQNWLFRKVCVAALYISPLLLFWFSFLLLFWIFR